MKKKKSKLLLVSKILFHSSFVIYGLIATAGPILLGNAAVINSALGIKTQIGSGNSDGSSTYFNTKFNKMSEVRDASLQIIEETVAEGAVLLKNENNALPLAKGDNVSVFGFASHYTVHTGQGSSGSSNKASRVSISDGIKNAGLNVNEALYNYYKTTDTSSFISGGNANDFSAASKQETQFVVNDANWNSLPSEKENKAKSAIMVIARTAGEAEDLYMDTTMDGENGNRIIVSKKNHNNVSGSVGDALELSNNEKSVLEGLKALKDAGKIDNIVVLMNTASALQCDFLEDPKYNIDACMWVGLPGTNGANAIGKLLTGEYNPSGRTTDTFFEESKYNPVYYNFGSIEYGDADSQLVNGYFSTMGYQNHKYYVAYQEGIYNGYKYTETRYEDAVTKRSNVGDFVYSDVVTYPFGYGLSYSTFEYSNMVVTRNEEKKNYTISVDVKNTSNVNGKEVVQFYVQKPYTALDITNGVEKPSVELVGFTKVDVKAGQTVTATTTIEEKYFASYDADVEKTYVIGSSNKNDEYLITAAKDAHDAVNNILNYKDEVKHISLDKDKIYVNDGRNQGNKDLVYARYIAYDKKTYSTNEFIKSENKNFTPEYEGQKANYGVNKITNQFDDTDFKKAKIFSSNEVNQKYLSRNNWVGTYGTRIKLTANSQLKKAQENPNVEKDNIAYPTYDEIGFVETGDSFDEVKLIYLRGKDYNDPLWDTLLNRMSYEETCALLQDGLRYTNAVKSIAAPSTAQQNGAIAPNHNRNYKDLPSQSAFRGFAEEKDKENAGQNPEIFACNGLVGATYNIDLIQRLGEQTGEEAIWAGYNGIYGLGVNIHRGAYCGRTFEYYSEDGFLTGVAAGYEAVGLHKLGVFVLMKHAVLNDQETHRAGLNVWANEQSIREIYSRALEVSIAIDREYTPNTVLGVMTGMNRLGAKWTGGQGFCNKVLRAEYGMRGYVVSDYNSSRPYMNPIQGVLYGNDLPDGNPAGSKGGYDYDGNDIRFINYKKGYGKLAWSMRRAAKNILYTIVNSNAMNGITGDSSFRTITPAWEIAVPVVTRVSMTIFIWFASLFGVIYIYETTKEILLKNKDESEIK